MYRFSVLFVTMTLIGCVARAAPYVQKGSNSIYRLFGFSDKKLADGVYFVRFEGTDGNTMPEVVEYVKRRAAELCGSPDFAAEIREFHRMRTVSSPDDPVGKGEGLMTHAPFPTAEAQVKCKPRP